MRYEFVEVFNDLIDCFLIADIHLLKKYKEEKALQDDLAYEFQNNKSGDDAVQNGIIIPIAGVENYPYTIIFTLSHEPPELFRPENRLQHQRSGYHLRVENQRIQFFTWRILQNLSEATVKQLLVRYQEPGKPQIEIANGNYDVEILAGEVLREDYYEPAFEIVLQPCKNFNMASKIDTSYLFTIDSDTY